MQKQAESVSPRGSGVVPANFIKPWTEDDLKKLTDFIANIAFQPLDFQKSVSVFIRDKLVNYLSKKYLSSEGTNNAEVISKISTGEIDITNPNSYLKLLTDTERKAWIDLVLFEDKLKRLSQIVPEVREIPQSVSSVYNSTTNSSYPLILQNGDFTQRSVSGSSSKNPRNYYFRAYDEGGSATIFYNILIDNKYISVSSDHFLTNFLDCKGRRLCTQTRVKVPWLRYNNQLYYLVYEIIHKSLFSATGYPWQTTVSVFADESGNELNSNSARSQYQRPCKGSDAIFAIVCELKEKIKSGTKS